jgi:hypothetical protein
LTFEAILNECNRLAAAQESHERGMRLKSRLLQLRIDYEKGIIDKEMYSKNEAEILKELKGR